MRKALLMFAQLSDRDIRWMEAHGQMAELPAGHRLIEAGQPVQAIYVVIEGSLSVIQGDTAIATLGRGEVVGEISLIMQHPPAASVVAATPIRVLAIAMTHLRSHLARDVEFAANFYHGLTILLANRLRRTTQLLGYGRDAEPFEIADAEETLETDTVDGMRLAHQRFDTLVGHFAHEPSSTAGASAPAR